MASSLVVGQITPEILKGRLDADEEYPVVDVRGEASYDGWHIPNAVNLYFDKESREFEDDPSETLPRDEQVVVVCAHGNTSRHAAKELSRQGYDAVTLEGGMLGWSQVFDVVNVDLDSDLVFKQVKRVANGCLSYVLGADGEAMIVDPAQHTDVYEEAIEGDERMHDEDGEVDVKYVAVTHLHADHISAGCSLADEHDAEFVVGGRVSERTETPEGCSDAYLADDGEILEVGGNDVEVIYTPGHTMESVSFDVEGGALLTGDTQFVDSVGRPDLEDGDEGAREHAEVLYESIFDRILALDDDLEVFPAHWGAEEVEAGRPVSASIGDIKETNEAVQLRDRDEFVEYILERLGSKPANHDEIIAINEGKRELCDPEIELGPNKCAVE
jgi:glyoxylase-like metal-dependent hydrolase (beta-lactamase superfamily II)